MTAGKFWGGVLGLLIGGLVLCAGLLVWHALTPVLDITDTYARLQQHGAAAQGKVLGIEQTSTFVNNRPVAKLLVSYRHGDQSREVEFEQVMPMTVLPRVQPGQIVPLRVDPAANGAVIVDLARLERPQR